MHFASAWQRLFGCGPGRPPSAAEAQAGDDRLDRLAKHLAKCSPALPLQEELVRSHRVRIRVVGAGKAAEEDRFDGLDLVEWTEASEIAEVHAMDIGIMPLVDRPFERGKSGYKLIQYMACGLPVVASPVGVNNEIVRDGENGLLAASGGEWREALVRLLTDEALRQRMGIRGRSRVSPNTHLPSRRRGLSS